MLDGNLVVSASQAVGRWQFHRSCGIRSYREDFYLYGRSFPFRNSIYVKKKNHFIELIITGPFLIYPVVRIIT